MEIFYNVNTDRETDVRVSDTGLRSRQTGLVYPAASGGENGTEEYKIYRRRDVRVSISDKPEKKLTAGLHKRCIACHTATYMPDKTQLHSKANKIMPHTWDDHSNFSQEHIQQCTASTRCPPAPPVLTENMPL